MTRAMLVLLALLAGASNAQEKKVMDFEADGVGQQPKGFEFGRTGEGRVGVWKVLVQQDAPSGKKVLAQTDADSTDNRFPVAFTGPATKDLRLSVRCKPVSGAGDQGCGLIFRGKQVLDEHDTTFTDAGKFGVWTKADSVIYFDDLSVTPL